MPRNRIVVGLAVALVLVGAGVAAAVVLSDKGTSTTRDAAQTGAVKTAAELPADAQPLPRSRARAVEPTTGVPSQDTGTDKNSPEYLAAHPPKSRAPTDAEIRQELAAYRKFKSTIDPRRFQNELLPTNVLTNITGWQTSIASVFTDFGLPIACPVNNGILHRDDLGVANKTLPCGTMVTFRYGGKGIRVPVIDRGPYIAGREWDFTGATAVALNFPGLGDVDWKIG